MDKKHNNRKKRKSAWIPESEWKTESVWELEQPFELDCVKKGVSKGNRHYSLKQYLGWMVKQKYTKQQALDTLLAWNKLNDPQLEEKEVIELFNKYWTEWTKDSS